MTNAFFVSPVFDIVKSLGWTLFHSLWQLSLVALALYCVLRRMRHATASSRYVVSLAALALMAAMPVVGFCYTTPSSVLENVWGTLWGGSTMDVSVSAREPEPVRSADFRADGAAINGQATRDSSPERAAYGGAGTPLGDLRHRLSVAVEPVLPWAVVAWCLGVLIGSLRLAFGGIWVYRTSRFLRNQAKGLVPELSTRLRSVIRESMPIRLVTSALVEVPTVIGWFKPVIVLPMSSVAGLSPQQFEAVIAHELAHLMRRDHIVNVCQTLADILLFYHPAAWWVSRQIREEREHCCDDIALRVCDSPYEYASALMTLVHNTVRAQSLAPVVCVTGGSIVRRVRRILHSAESDNRATRWISGLAMLIVTTGLLWGLASSTVLGVLAANPGADTESGWNQMEFPNPGVLASEASVVGAICSRKPGTDSFFDWKEEMPASGLVFMPPDREFALMINPERASDLQFLEALPSDSLTGLLLGTFFVYRAGYEPPEKTYADILQTEGRPRVLIADEQMAHVAHLDGLRELYLDHATIGDAGMALLAELDSLEIVSLVDTDITDASLAYLAALPNLRRLNLAQTDVTDAGIAYLASSESLEDITLDRTNVTDTGLAYLSALDQLRRLSVNFTGITNAGLEPLYELPNLATLRTWGTNTPQAQRENAAYGTGQLKYGLPTPKVGILLSDFTARTGGHWMQYEYTYRHALGTAELLIDLGYDLYAVVEPGTEDKGRLPDVLARLGLQDRIVNATDPVALGQLDVVVSGFDANVLDDVQSALTQAVKEGMGFFNFCLWGVVYPGSGPGLEEFLGIGKPQYFMQFQFVDCDVVAKHPILGDLQPGDMFTAKWLNGFAGELRGTPLLMAGNKEQPFSPLYVYELGEGTVVNMQWQKPTVSNGGIDPVAFYGRCVNYAAKVPVDATW